MRFRNVRRLIYVLIIVVVFSSLVSCKKSKSEEELKSEIRIEMEKEAADKAEAENTKEVDQSNDLEDKETVSTEAVEQTEPSESIETITTKDKYMSKQGEMLEVMSEFYYEDISEDMFEALNYEILDVTNDGEEEIIMYGDSLSQIFVLKLVEDRPIVIVNDISKFGDVIEEKFFKKDDFLVYEFRSPGEVNDSTYRSFHIYDTDQLHSATDLIKTRMKYDYEGVKTTTTVTFKDEENGFIVDSSVVNDDGIIHSVEKIKYTYNEIGRVFDKKIIDRIVYNKPYYRPNPVRLQDGIFIADLKKGDKLAPNITVVEASNNNEAAHYVLACDDMVVTGYISFNEMFGDYSVSVSQRLFNKPIIVGESSESELYKLTSINPTSANINLEQFVSEKDKENPFDMKPIPVEFSIRKIESTFAYGSEGGTYIELVDLKVLDEDLTSTEIKNAIFEKYKFKPVEAMALDYSFLVDEEKLRITGSYDLDQDGTMDQIEIVNEANWRSTGTIKINTSEKEYEFDSVYGTVKLFDINRNDDYIEIGILDDGPSADENYLLYRYSKDYGIEALGSISIYGLSDGEGRFVSMFDKVMFEPSFFTAYYELFTHGYSVTPVYIEDEYKDKWFECKGEVSFVEGESSESKSRKSFFDGEMIRDFRLKILNVDYNKNTSYSSFGNIVGYDVELEDGRVGYLRFWMGD